MSQTSPAFDEPPAASADGRGERLVFIDVLRVAISVMVVVHHAAQAYGPTGGLPTRAQSEWFRVSLLRSALEALICASLSVGLVVLLREVFIGPGHFSWRWRLPAMRRTSCTSTSH